jgi:hypothetical protein
MTLSPLRYVISKLVLHLFYINVDVASYLFFSFLFFFFFFSFFFHFFFPFFFFFFFCFLLEKQRSALGSFCLTLSLSRSSLKPVSRLFLSPTGAISIVLLSLYPIGWPITPASFPPADLHLHRHRSSSPLSLSLSGRRSDLAVSVLHQHPFE